MDELIDLLLEVLGGIVELIIDNRKEKKQIKEIKKKDDIDFQKIQDK